MVLTFLERCRDAFRMIFWLLLGVACYAAALQFDPKIDELQANLQLIFFKLGNINTALFVGYWADRSAFFYARPHDYPAVPALQLRRAILMGASALAAGL